MTGIFKAYDVRGIYPDPLNEEIALAIGRSFAQLLVGSPAEHARDVVVSHDMRPHSQPLEEQLVAGLTWAGYDVVDIGLATTPMNYWAVGELGAAGGVQVTASHNPARYNGFKFSLHGARPVSGDEGIPRIERLATGPADRLVRGERPGTVRQASIEDRYAEFVLSRLQRPAGARSLKVVVDAANGMGAVYRPILERAGIDLIPLYFELDGSFPNHEANPLKLDNLRDLCAKVREVGADLGVAFDGDADRAGFVDDRGEPVGSDLATALIACAKLEHRPGAAVVYDLRSSRAVPEAIEEAGGVPLRERVGHSFIKARMREHDAVFGGELAGHYYFPETYFADSSILAVFEMLNLLWRTGQRFSELVAPLARYAKSPEINFEVDDKVGAMQALRRRYSGGELDEIDGIRIDFDDWWFNVRPSNTEPLLRLVLEAKTPELLAAKQAELIAQLGEPV
ncbi:MAG: phosphomannomutase/phosphoglucomutase [Acidobacteria bacterium]|nr:MAG: phosphomannomutase/phosphoglucomutase [Acidobacteriota bacterium]REK05591.1 MAG: phosphomannomutase/phosphoglucomutase [Acidobacteriota bacterium]